MLEELSLCFGVMVVGVLWKVFIEEGVFVVFFIDNKYYFNVLVYYCEVLKM